MIELLMQLYNTATLYAQLVAVPLFTLITLIWGWRHQQWLPKPEMGWIEKLIMKTVTLAVVFTPTAGLLIGQWAQALLISIPLIYVFWIGVVHAHKGYAGVGVLLGITGTVGVMGWWFNNPITAILLLLLTVGTWELWLTFLTQVRTLQVGWVAFISTTLVYILSKRKGLSADDLARYSAIEARRQKLIPTVLSESVQLTPAVFLILFLIKNLW